MTEVTLSPQVLTKEVFKEDGVRYYDAKGNLVSETSTASSHKTVEKNLNELDPNAVKVENNKGTELPSTGGMGTTLLYVGGSILVILAAVLLITKRRMNADE
jgi:LPXTG-motif cell wall-anchored protein